MDVKKLQQKLNAGASVAGLAVFSLALSMASRAAPTNPFPGDFFDDTGVETFASAGNLSLSAEFIDILGFTSAVEFGFYASGDPDTRTAVFDFLDQDTGIGPQSAVIDFNTGFVYDFDAGEVQSAFDANAFDEFGFYLDINFGAGAVTLFTESSLNLGGDDASAVFQSKLDPSAFLVGFEYDFGDGPVDISLHLVTDIIPVPAPPSILLLSLGLGFLTVLRKRKGKTRGACKITC